MIRIALLILLSSFNLHSQDYKTLYQKCVQFAESNFDSAQYYCVQAESAAPASIRDSVSLWIDMRKAISLSAAGDYESSSSILFELIKKAEKSQDLLLLSELYNNLGIDYFYQDDYQGSFQYYSLSYEIAERIDDYSSMAYAKMNIGMVAGYQGLKDRELQYYIEAKELFSSIRDSIGLADATLNIGTMYHENGAYKDALENFENALRYYESHQYNDAVVQSLLNFAETYTEIGDNRLAINNATKALQLSRLYGFKQDELYAEEVLYKLFAKLGDWNKAYDHLSRFNSVENALFNIEKSEQLQKVRAQYDLEKKESDILLLQAQNGLKELNLERYRYMVVALVVSALLLAMTFYFFINKTTLEKKLLSAEVDQLKNDIMLQLGKEQIWTQEDLRPLNQSLSESLSERELEILEFILNGQSNSDISKELFISINTVKFHLRNIYSKLGVANRKEAKSLIQTQIIEDYQKNSPHQ